MRLIAGMVSFAIGYALLYYGIVMYRQYVPNNPAVTRGIPFTALLGSTGPGGDVAGDWSHPPFIWSVSGANQTTPNASPGNSAPSTIKPPSQSAPGSVLSA